MKITSNKQKKIAVVAHDHKKNELLQWAIYNKGTLKKHKLFGTGTTGQLIADKLDIDIVKFKSGPLGGDQQIGAKIAEGEIDVLVFFWDPLEPLPHDPDIKALLRIAAVYNIPIACNKASADFIISSPMMNEKYEREVENFSERKNNH